ncbi:hypothetical protein ISS03_00640 [Patescibacteria group bacterium]|nr:hypothetical protein [Patescibacteria group bacterium]
MPRNLIALIIIIVGFLMIIGISIFIYQASKSQPDQAVTVTIPKEVAEKVATDTPVESITAKKKSVVIEQKKQPEVVEKSSDEEALERIAGSFIERYGTQSTASNYSNLEDSLVYMSEKMKTETKNELIQLRAGGDDINDYQGMTTRAVSKKIIEYDKENGSAKVTIGTIRAKLNGDVQDLSRKKQNVEVRFVKESGTWKVDGVVWAK